jgi:hypothetical protein
MTKEALKGLFEIVEGNEFAAKIGVASRFSAFEAGIKAEPAIQALLGLVAPQETNAVAKRLLVLCRRKIDDRYANPWDFAITSYLWILSNKEMELAKVAEVVAETPNLWWGKYLSDYLIDLQAKAHEFSLPCSQKNRASISWDYVQAKPSKSVSIRGGDIKRYDKDRKKVYKLAA